MGILEKLTGPETLRELSKEETAQLCEEIRKFLVQTVSQTGGHLSSNLGAVELTVALHRVFDTEKDRIVFDVGHQSYVHKLLTGRKNDFGSLRSYGGMAGFPKPSESVHDAFIGGHASDSVSVALGMARARTLQKDDYSVIAVIGDGALTGGLAYEGLEDGGESGEPLIVILNDNGMSITQNVGGVASYLSHLRLKPGYYRLKKAYRRFTAAVPGGKALYGFTHRVKKKMRNVMIGRTMFEDMGFTYLGPVDGHDVEKLTYLLNYAREINGPVLLHIITTKGRGYKYSEERPDTYHGIGAFDAVKGVAPSKKVCFSDVFGQTLCQLSEENEKVCAITAAMKTGTGLEEFSTAYPERFFDVGIAEGHGVSMAAGLAKQGMTPVFAVYSTFLQRSYDMLIHDVALLGLHVVLAVDRAGLVGDDGETHHGVFDTGFLRQVPGMTVYCPGSFDELRSMLKMAVEDQTGPVAVRYPRGGEGRYIEDRSEGETAVIKDGKDITVAVYGTMINEAMAAAEKLRRKGVEAKVIKINKIAPLDTAAIRELVTGQLVVAEETMASCSVVSQIAAAMPDVSVTGLNLGDTFVKHGTVAQLRHERGIDSEGIEKTVISLLRREKENG